ncbi:hypothetical protein [Rhizobium sp. WYJ-E13]|uniref:hypothetical protein n=1 Tax=Rhizobium sp. WYJ-E13 TaxID=2849093 RepID=UPI001C1EC802|nr:hypothetical protein [Rhizobium sp. WYJ-E13]QWW66548.1 hypothetical protein KQ933_13045 [Rhizobium sp. WYJ-E13]
MTEFTVHVTRSSQANDHCFQVPFDIPSGTTIFGLVSGTADIRGAMSDRIVRPGQAFSPKKRSKRRNGRTAFRDRQKPCGARKSSWKLRSSQSGSPVHIEGIRN